MTLSDDLLIELAKLCIVSKDSLEAIKPHMKYSFLQEETYKSIFKYIFDYHSANSASPTIGLLSQNVNSRASLDVIGRIREANVFDSKDKLMEQFEEFVKKSRLAVLFKRVEDIHNAGDIDRALSILAQESGEVNNFSLKRKMYSRIFADFDKRQMERMVRDFTVRKIPTGIPAFDHHSRGGPDRGTASLGIARSGIGKTTYLRSLGFNAAFRGFNVLHLSSADSTKDEVETGYDSAWTGVDLYEMKEGKLTGVSYKEVERAKQAYLAQCGEIFIHCFNQFNSPTILECRSILIDILREHRIDLVLFDYLEKFNPGDERKYGANDDSNRMRLMATAEKIVSIATEFDVVCATVTQANNIPKEIWNDPSKVLDRSNIANLKALIDPFAYCMTLNQTEDENDKEIMRIHEEKMRHYKIHSFNSTYRISQKRSVGRFIDIPETNRMYWDVETKKIKRGIK